MYESVVSLHRQVYYSSDFQHNVGSNVEKGSIIAKNEGVKNSQEITPQSESSGFFTLKLDDVDELSDKLEFYSRRYGGM